MANAVYPLWKQTVIQAGANSSLAGSGTTGTFCSLVNTADHSYSSSDQYFSAFSGTVGTDQEITTKSYTTGTFSGANLTYTSVTGSTVSALVFYVKNSGASSTWQLFLYLDTSQTGLPLTPNGGNITITWSGSGIFTISDRDAKENVEFLGSIGPADFYAFNYRGAAERTIGLMAQDVERYAPQAVREIDGRKRVDYSAALDCALQRAA